MGNLLKHGIELYKQTVNLKNEPEMPPPVLPSEIKRSKTLTKQTKQEDTPKESKFRRLAKFLILIGSEQAAKILAELDPEHVNEVSKEVALTKAIKPEERDEILLEFQELLSGVYQFSGASQGGIEAARRILYAAKGPEKGEELLNRVIPETKENLFSFLEEFSIEQLVMLIKTETAQTIALILSRLPAKLSAGILSKLAPDLKPKVLKCIAKQSEVAPEVLEQITAALKERVRHISGGADDYEIDGIQTLAAILKQGDYSFGNRLIDELEEEHPDIGKDLKENLFTLDDIILTVDRSVQDKLKTMTDQNIALLLKGRNQEFCEKILSNVSAGRRQVIREEFEVLGAVSKRECDAAAKEFLSWFRLERERGNILLYTDEDVFL